MNRANNAAADDAVRIRYRIRFGKVDLLRWISHRDIARLWERVGRRAGLDFSMTEGFHPKPRISFPSALALGVCGDNEVVEIELASPMDADELKQRLIDDRQPGLIIREVRRRDPGASKAKIDHVVYQCPVPPSWSDDDVDRAVAKVRDTDHIDVERKKKTGVKTQTFILSDHVREITAVKLTPSGDPAIHIVMNESDGANLRIADLYPVMGIDEKDAPAIRRTDVVLADEIEQPRIQALPSELIR